MGLQCHHQPASPSRFVSSHHKHSRYPQNFGELLLGAQAGIPSLCQPPGTGKSHMAWLSPFKPLWGLGLSSSRGPQPRSPASTLCPPPDKGSTIDPGAARSRLCQEMQFTTSLEVTAEEASRLLALLCRYKKPFKGPLCEPRSSLQHRREAAESRERTATGLPFKRPNHIPNPGNLFPLFMNSGTCAWRLGAPGTVPSRRMQSGPFLTSSHL